MASGGECGEGRGVKAIEDPENGSIFWDRSPPMLLNRTSRGMKKGYVPLLIAHCSLQRDITK